MKYDLKEIKEYHIIGGFLIFEGILSAAYSKDQEPVSTFGRVGRIFLGLWLVLR